MKLASIAILGMAMVFHAAVGTSMEPTQLPSADRRIDAQAEVAAVLYAASATQAALAKSVDAQLKSKQSRIDALAAQIKAGDTRQRAEMAAAQESFIAQLAEKDREYAVQIGLFRSTVTDIAATPDGVTALERFNAGDEVGALSILDRLRAINEKMRQTKARLEDAAEGRRIARLALEARIRGKLTTQAVIARFEEVVHLDPGVGDDWLQLDRLYQDTGQLAEAKKATESFEAAAHDDGERALASSERSDVLQLMGDLAGARAAAERAISISRRMLQADPKSDHVLYTLARCLESFGEDAMAQGDLVTAQNAYIEDVDIARRRVAADATSARARNSLAAALLHMASALLARGHMGEARKAAEDSLQLTRTLASEAPESVVYRRQASVTLMWLSDIYVSQGAFEEARRANAEIVATCSKLVAADSANASSQRDLVYGLTKTAWVQRIEGDFDASLKTYEQALRISRDLAKSAKNETNLLQDVGNELGQIADVRHLTHEAQGSREAADEAIAILQSLVAADPTDANNKQLLASVFYSRGAALVDTADYQAARESYEQGFRLDLALLAVNSDHQQVDSDLSGGHLGMGRLLLAQGDIPAAVKSLQDSLDSRRRLAKAQPGSSTPERAVAEAMRALVDIPGSELKWADFRTQVEAMDHQGILWPADRVWLEEARQHDSREVTR